MDRSPDTSPIQAFKHQVDDRPYLSIVQSGQRLTSTFASSACVAVITSGSGRVTNSLDPNDAALAAEASKRGFVKQVDGWWWFSPEQASSQHATVYLACLELAQAYARFRTRHQGSIANLKRAVEHVIQAAQIPPQPTE
jgi:hypothetical protein